MRYLTPLVDDYEMKYSKPDFLVIGAPKSGTTSLFHYLSQHYQIIPPEYKEPAFFAWHNKKGYNWYLSKFPKLNNKGKRLTFEATPMYLYNESSPSLINMYLPEVKMISILRDPVERAYSHWNFYHTSKYINETEWRISNIKDNRSFEEAVTHELNGYILSDAHAYLKIGCYKEQINRFLTYFKREQMLFLDYRDMKRNINKFLTSVCDFLNIDKDVYRNVEYNSVVHDTYIAKGEMKNSNFSSKQFEIHNANLYKKEISIELRNKLYSFFNEKNKGLNDLIGNEFEWHQKDTRD